MTSLSSLPSSHHHLNYCSQFLLRHQIYWRIFFIEWDRAFVTDERVALIDRSICWFMRRIQDESNAWLSGNRLKHTPRLVLHYNGADSIAAWLRQYFRIASSVLFVSVVQVDPYPYEENISLCLYLWYVKVPLL